ncbi:MAG: 5-(carboxyamino)imidazole ribonucleotide synthase [Hyphomicrobiales bacterium]|nr:5-(carboxyamino)imidazole ribonucleotide synthase [Hyphomicrobiales bacterium]
MSDSLVPPLPPPVRTVGILGGGQLGRMMALAGARLGLKSVIYCPDVDSPAFDVAADHVCAPYDDEAALADFAARVDVVTYEFENVPAATAAFLDARVPVRPGTRSLAVSQDRLSEKTFLAELGVPTAPFRAVDSLADLESAIAEIGFPAVLKTRRFGYDGKGQVKITDPDDLAHAFEAMKGAPAILEGWVPFRREISVLTARGLDGRAVTFDVPENEHARHILKYSRVPADLKPETAARAVAVGEAVAAALDHVGVVAVELFLVETAQGERLVANEIAPRVHNSGHWTESACLVSQFEAHMRAVAGLPLGAPTRHSDVVMENLIGDEARDPERFLAEDGASLHLYGKAEIRPGRKMGHVNRIRPRADRG